MHTTGAIRTYQCMHGVVQASHGSTHEHGEPARLGLEVATLIHC
jgi:hypothetical protein